MSSRSLDWTKFVWEKHPALNVSGQACMAASLFVFIRATVRGVCRLKSPSEIGFFVCTYLNQNNGKIQL